VDLEPHAGPSKVGKVEGHTASVNPLRQIVAALQCGSHLTAIHGSVLGEVLSVLPLEELDAILRHWLTAEVAVRSRLLVLGLTECQRLGDGTWPAVKFHLEHICDIIDSELALLAAIGLHEE